MTRSELFALVWKEPLTLLAPRLGVSAPTLLKLCRMHRIPVPGRGHWAKTKAGRCIEADPLPVGDDVEIQLRQERAPSESGPVFHSANQTGVLGDAPVDGSRGGAISLEGDVHRLLDAVLAARMSAAASGCLAEALMMVDELSPDAGQAVRAWVLRLKR